MFTLIGLLDASNWNASFWDACTGKFGHAPNWDASIWDKDIWDDTHVACRQASGVFTPECKRHNRNAQVQHFVKS